MKATDLITFENVSFSYDDTDNDSPAALKSLNLSIKKGEFTAVLGHNGSGKSTMAKLINGLLKPTKGEIYVDGMLVNDENNELSIRKKVGLVFQNPDNQLIATSVEDDVAFGLENIGVPQAEMETRIVEALKAVEMLEYRNYSPYNLSGGQKQRIAIAGVLAMEPECIVFDEPTAMLDPRGRKEVINTLISLAKNKNITVILITHFMDEAALADRLIVMNDGDVLLDGTPKKVFKNVELLHSVGLDVPVASQLLFELAKDGKDLKIDAVTVDDCVKALTEAFGRK